MGKTCLLSCCLRWHCASCGAPFLGGSQVQFLVLDEADRLFEMGFVQQVRDSRQTFQLRQVAVQTESALSQAPTSASAWLAD